MAIKNFSSANKIKYPKTRDTVLRFHGHVVPKSKVLSIFARLKTVFDLSSYQIVAMKP
jgi:hypothetical protein